MARFEVGKKYSWYQREYGSIEVLRRTDKTITVTNGMTTWKMLIRKDYDGEEYVVDSSVPSAGRDAFTCYAGFEEGNE